MYVNKLLVTKEHRYKSGTLASGTDWVKYQASKVRLDVGIIPLDADAMARLLADVDKFNVLIAYRDPITNMLVENVKCVISDYSVDYHTIQDSKVMYKAFSIQIREL
jgi:hypothetical protein